MQFYEIQFGVLIQLMKQCEKFHQIKQLECHQIIHFFGENPIQQFFRFSMAASSSGCPAFVRPCSGLSQIACAPEMAGGLNWTVWKISFCAQHFWGFQKNGVRRCEDPEASKSGVLFSSKRKGFEPCRWDSL